MPAAALTRVGFKPAGSVAKWPVSLCTARRRLISSATTSTDSRTPTSGTNDGSMKQHRIHWYLFCITNQNETIFFSELFAFNNMKTIQCSENARRKFPLKFGFPNNSPCNSTDNEYFQVRFYWTAFPTDQMLGGRNLRLSPLHQACQEQGAFFGSTGGWERPLFFVPEMGESLRVPEYDW